MVFEKKKDGMRNSSITSVGISNGVFTNIIFSYNKVKALAQL